MSLSPAARSLRRPFAPRLEVLEGRCCPTAPFISYTHSPAGLHNFLITGHVYDDQPGGLTVQFSGAYSGLTVTGRLGDFCMVIQPKQLGSLFAHVTDGEGLSSEAVQDVLTSAAPTISNFTATHLLGNCWTFSGVVTDELPGGLVVQLGGLPSLEGVATTVGSDGTFSVTVELQQGEEGTATAQTTDWWGQDSNEALCLVHPIS